MQNLSDSTRFRLLILALLLLFCSSYLHQFIVAEATYPVLKYFRGGDFPPFFYKAQEVSGGGEMYPNLTKPPLFILILIPLIPYGLGFAITAFQLVTLALVLFGVVLFCRKSGQGFWVQVAVLACLLTSWAFGFLIDRANADGLSMGLAAMSVVAIASRMPFLGWGLFAIGVNLKSNILPLALPLILSGRLFPTLRSGLWFSLATISVAALTPRWSLEWIRVASQRVTMSVNMDQSTSIYPAWLMLNNGNALATKFLFISTALIVLGMIVQNLVSKRANPLLGFTLLLPCTYAYPALTYPYSMVLFPLLLFTYGFSSSQRGFFGFLFSASAYVGALGLLAQDFPMFYWQKYLTSPWVGLIPSIGVSLTLIANAVLAWSPGLHMNAFQSTKEGAPNTRLNRLGELTGVLGLAALALGATWSVYSFLMSQP